MRAASKASTPRRSRSCHSTAAASDSRAHAAAARFVKRSLAACLRALAIAACACGASGCYYAHVTRGQLSLLAHREPVERVIADPATDPKLRTRLAETQDARRFASEQLGLPGNRSYTSYVDLG